MNEVIENVYIKILKHGWIVQECELLENNYLSLHIHDPSIIPEDRAYWVKTINNLGVFFRAPTRDKSCSYLITPQDRDAQ